MNPSTEAVFFPFDTYNVPLHAGLAVKLVSARKHPVPVLRRGKEGSVDSVQVGYYGSVMKIDGKYHMWYLGGGSSDTSWIKNFPGWHMEHVCYATSVDGITWEKPELGIVEYDGRKNNNLVDLGGIRDRVDAIVVIHEPEDPDPGRRFKMLFESHKYGNKMGVAFSGDGLHWRESALNPVLPYVVEMSGLVKRGECYYANGQTAGTPARILCTQISYDFEHWSVACNYGHRRDNIPGRFPLPYENAGLQVHLGAALWDRGNTMLGFYGIWNGVNQDRRSVIMDLGLLVTTDAIHYQEPVPDFPIVPAEEESDGAGTALMQGQGWDNTETETLYWYGAWRDGEVRLARWDRDRLGYVSARDDWRYAKSHLWTAPFCIDGESAEVYVNIDGVSEHNRIAVELTDEKMVPVRGFEATQCNAITNGFRSQITWRGHDRIPISDKSMRLRIDFEGLRSHDIKLYALYISETTTV